MPHYVDGMNPDVLKWAREKSGYSLAVVANRLKKKIKDIEEWENGESVPTYNQLETMAYSLYKRPIAMFFFPSPPEETTTEQSFRTLPEPEVKSFLPDTRYAIRMAQARQSELYELTGGRNQSDRVIFRDLQFDTGLNPYTAAHRVRNYLGVRLAEQRSWRDTRTALKNWRQIVEEHGVFVFKRSFKQGDISGFCLTDPEFPVIYINNSTAKSRQIFTLFHELCHLLLGVNGVTKRHGRYVVDLSGPSENIETFCNEFTAEFLVPSEDFDADFRADQPLEGEVHRLARRYNVSREVILRNFLDRGMIDQAYYHKKAEEWTADFFEHRATDNGGDYYNTKAAYLGRNYLRLAFGRYYEGIISLGELADYLDVKAQNVGGLEPLVLSRS